MGKVVVKEREALNKNNNSVSRGVSFGLLGGLLGAIVMGGIAYMMPIPNTGGAPFFVAIAMMMGFGAISTAVGWTLHLITGLVVGGIFGIVTSRLSRLRVSSIGRGVGLGILAGSIVWIALFMPLLVSQMPALISMGTLIAGSFAAHIIYGLILGGVVGAFLPKAASVQTCTMCGAQFNNREDLMKHSEEHMKARTETEAKQHQCEACGATFKSKTELMNHAQKAHPMPTMQKK